MWFDWKNWNFEYPKNTIEHKQSNIDVDLKYNSVFFFIFVAVSLFFKIYIHFSDNTMPFCSVVVIANIIDFLKNVFEYTYNIPENFPAEFVCDFRISNAFSYVFLLFVLLIKFFFDASIRPVIFDKNSIKMLILFIFVFLLLYFLQKIDRSNPDIFQYNSYSRFENVAFTTTVMFFFCITFIFYYMAATFKQFTNYVFNRIFN